MNKIDPEQFFEEVAKVCPELIQKTQLSVFSVGPGWHTILYVLCNAIYAPLYNAKSRLKAAVDYPRGDNNEYFIKCSLDVDKELALLPEITQVKEKFGTLRFYVNNSSARVNALIGFAESMSEHICEQCGKPGKISTTNHGTIITVCADHDETLLDSKIENGRVRPNLFVD